MKAPIGEKAFDAYFSSVYGSRWPDIKQALLLEDKKVARKNQFAEADEFTGVGEAHEFLQHCYELQENFDLGAFTDALLPFYRMDPASMIAARSLETEPGQRILDMCAAPGGKSLILIENLLFAGYKKGEEPSGLFVANELSAKRRFRMMSVFKRYIPKGVRSHIKIKGMDGSLFGLQQKDTFDGVLLDAPCSGERGVVKKASDLAQWKEKRSKSFGIRQYSLLASAFSTLKSGGSLLYSTCSISPLENDEVIRKLLKRKSGEFEIVPLPQVGPSEATEFGRQFLPDRDGWGPIFYCSIKKN